MALKEWVTRFYDAPGEDNPSIPESIHLQCDSKDTHNDRNTSTSSSAMLKRKVPVEETHDTLECFQNLKKCKENDQPILTKDELFKRMNLDKSWVSFIEFTDFDIDTLVKLQVFLEEQRSLEIIYPAPKNVHRWSCLCTPDQVKIIIVGQDPYPQPHRADGLAFSTGDGSVSPSLRNIYKELHRSIEGFVIPAHGHLESWAKQGVLLLNTAFTVVRGIPGSHASIGWKTLSDRVIMQLSARRSNLVFMLWGNHAKEKIGLIDKTKHCVLTSSHPSPLAATRCSSFVGNNHFIKANNYIKEHGKDPINWNTLIDHTS
uniref:Uracil DNA glycosylase n=1 Tax=Elephant endotheliotropic herpesvirus 1B TaxID=759754 RepID=A0A075WLF3_ELHV1|nr:uracil DNA glycosylase [Elephant endotheliotropic herpesvirus 1B]